MQGIEAPVHDELRAGRPRTHDDERVAEVICTQTKPMPPIGACAPWPSKAASPRAPCNSAPTPPPALLALQYDPFPRRCAISSLNPPDHAKELCVDEKTQSRPTRTMCRWGWATSKGSPTIVRHCTVMRRASPPDRSCHDGVSRLPARWWQHRANVPEPFDVHLSPPTPPTSTGLAKGRDPRRYLHTGLCHVAQQGERGSASSYEPSRLASANVAAPYPQSERRHISRTQH